MINICYMLLLFVTYLATLSAATAPVVGGKEGFKAVRATYEKQPEQDQAEAIRLATEQRKANAAAKKKAASTALAKQTAAATETLQRVGRATAARKQLGDLKQNAAQRNDIKRAEKENRQDIEIEEQDAMDQLAKMQTKITALRQQEADKKAALEADIAATMKMANADIAANQAARDAQKSLCPHCKTNLRFVSENHVTTCPCLEPGKLEKLQNFVARCKADAAANPSNQTKQTILRGAQAELASFIKQCPNPVPAQAASVIEEPASPKKRTREEDVTGDIARKEQAKQARTEMRTTLRDLTEHDKNSLRNAKATNEKTFKETVDRIEKELTASGTVKMLAFIKTLKPAESKELGPRDQKLEDLEIFVDKCRAALTSDRTNVNKQRMLQVAERDLAEYKKTLRGQPTDDDNMSQAQKQFLINQKAQAARKARGVTW